MVVIHHHIRLTLYSFKRGMWHVAAVSSWPSHLRAAVARAKHRVTFLQRYETLLPNAVINRYRECCSCSMCSIAWCQVGDCRMQHVQSRMQSAERESPSKCRVLSLFGRRKTSGFLRIFNVYPCHAFIENAFGLLGFVDSIRICGASFRLT